MLFDIELVRKVYSELPSKIEKARKSVNRPLTLSEKILFSHLWDELPAKPYGRGEDYVNFGPDRVAMQDATAQMALLQFMTAGRSRTAVPSTVHCDHLIRAHSGAVPDLPASMKATQAAPLQRSIRDFGTIVAVSPYCASSGPRSSTL